MLRLLTTSASRLSAGRIAMRTCPAHVVRMAPALTTTVHHQACVAHPNTTVRAFTAARQLKAEEEEERAPVSLADARAALVQSLAEDISSLDLTNSWTQEYIQSTELKVKTNAENQGVLAVRQVDGHTIRVTFRADDYQEADLDEEDEQNENANDSEEPMSEHMFFVDIVNESSRKIVRVDCSNAPDGELVIHSLSFPTEVSPDPTATAAAAKDTELSSQSDNALDFNDLNEPSQEKFIDLLERLGVDDDLALFVANQAQLVRTMKLAADMNKLKAFAQ